MTFIYLPLLALLLGLAGCDALKGPPGPAGPQGPRGLPGQCIAIETLTGTVYNKNYTKKNPRFASIPLWGNHDQEPVVLFFGIENNNGIFIKTEFGAVIWSGYNEDHTVPGTRGWHMLVHDRSKRLRGSNYQVKFIRAEAGQRNE